MKDTDISRWREIAENYRAGWDDRAALISYFIRHSDTVLDLGAGGQNLKKFIPQSCGYIPVDCVDVREGTFVVDFNKEFRLPDADFSVVVCAGFLGYLNDLDGFLQALCNNCEHKQIIFSYSTVEKSEKIKMSARRNHLGTLENCVEFFSNYVRELRPVMVLQREWIFSGVIGPGSANPVTHSPINTILLKRTPLRKLIAQKIAMNYLPAR